MYLSYVPLDVSRSSALLRECPSKGHDYACWPCPFSKGEDKKDGGAILNSEICAHVKGGRTQFGLLSKTQINFFLKKHLLYLGIALLRQYPVPKKYSE